MFRTHIQTEIEINASAQEIWHHLTDLASYPRWNPFILCASGEVKYQGKLNVFIQPPGSQGMAFTEERLPYCSY